jgi:DNA/RNA endonuclease YhcR with UshA esterase domain
MKSLMRTLLSAAVVCVFAASSLLAADEPTVVQASEAKANVGKKVTIEMTVVAGAKLADKGPCFLNASKNYKDKDAFSVVMFGPALTKFKEAGIDDPSKHFKDKKIQVTGTVELYKEQPQIKVTSPDQIKIAEEAKVGF